ncbi:trehalose-phosphatase [Pleomorphomonas carboxyditropha]|uniref:Trehalose 6-phosphate phosphatase n=2 Tax=Pleomorphomonas carboxyditropha TaxID=2023338 RepID=A0A2G9X026_9HYPH|nr:trehalose-phosphatase [Pleomorphomonas carboxyditropha]
MMPPVVQPGKIALMLDFDGTLVPYASETRLIPEVDPRLPGLLERLVQRTGGATAIVSGRGVAEFDKLLGPIQLAISGAHGFEFRAAPNSPIEFGLAGENLNRIVEGLERLFALSSAWAEKHRGVYVERKSLTVVLQFHDALEIADLACQFAFDTCKVMPDFALQAGRGVAEFRPVVADKGCGIGRLMARVPFSGRIPVFIGDDLADEAGFLIVNSLGGISIRVGPGESNAPYRLQDTREVLAFINSIAA